MILIACALLAFTPQTAREPVHVSTSSLGGVAIASADDLSVVVLRDEGAPGLRMRTSDGRGVDWSPSIRVDQAPQGTGFGSATALVDGGTAWISWIDNRGGGFDAFVRSYDAATGVLGPEASPSAGLPGSVEASADMDVARVGDERSVHVAMIVTWTEPGGGTSQQVMLASSTDGGTTFSPAIPVTPPVSLTGTSSFSRVAVEAEEDVVYVAWSFGDTFGEDTYLQRSSDGGLTFDFAPAVSLSSAQHTLLVRMKAVGTTLALVLWSYHNEFPISVQEVVVSVDAGVTFMGEYLVLPPKSGFPVSWNGEVAIGADGATVVGAWEEWSSGKYEIYWIRTTDGGATWSSPQPLTADGGTFVKLAAAGLDRGRVVATWQDPLTGRPVARLSYDGGASFGGAIELAPHEISGGVLLAYNDRYQNAVAHWLTPATPHERYVGGLRPQHVEPLGFTAGSTSIGATLGGFDDGSPLAFLLLSSAPGDLVLPFGDGRALGLALTPLFFQSVSVALAGPLAAALAPDGSGALTPFAVPPLPPGTLHAAAVALDLATLSFGDVSDVVVLEL